MIMTVAGARADATFAPRARLRAPALQAEPTDRRKSGERENRSSDPASHSPSLSLSLSLSFEPRANELLLIIEGRSAIASRVVKSRASSRRDSACTLALVVVLVAGSARNSLLRLASGTALYLPWYAQVDRYILTSTLPRARERVLYPRARARASLRARCVSLARSLARSLVYVQHTLNISSQS